MGLDILIDGPEVGATLLLAHGAGAPMDSPGLTAMAQAIAQEGVRIARFEFAYMAARRTGGARPPPRGETLVPEYRAAVEALGGKGPLVIGGKSLGGRVASMVADELWADGRIAGLVCLGYPFHPPGRPKELRTKHLADLRTPTLICQGTRDPFGGIGEVPGYPLASAIEILWLPDGDHDLRPRKSISGYTVADHLKTMAAVVAAFTRRVAG